MTKIVALIGLMAVTGLLVNTAIAADSNAHSYAPPSGYVPNAETAIRIAEAVWLPIYGEVIFKSKPFTAKLHDDIWHVEGSLPEAQEGGVPEAEIAKKDGRILRVIHGQ